MIFEAMAILLSVVAYVGIPILVVYLLGESFFRKRKRYKRAKENEGVSIADRISLVIHGIVFFVILIILILVILILTLSFTGIMQFM
ncbi:MAG: hypothetical protein E7263_07555 [Lachnospiraceae bacterium]|nr:hypothetical protein [Lachnospiraceae bacterium]